MQGSILSNLRIVKKHRAVSLSRSRNAAVFHKPLFRDQLTIVEHHAAIQSPREEKLPATIFLTMGFGIMTVGKLDFRSGENYSWPVLARKFEHVLLRAAGLNKPPDTASFAGTGTTVATGSMSLDAKLELVPYDPLDAAR